MFSKETEYALRGLVYIQYQNFKGEKPGVAEIAREIDAPPFYIAKILHRMVKSGFVESIKGKGGGFYFDETKENLAVKDLILVTEGDKTLNGCGFGFKMCSSGNPCPMHEQFVSIRDELNKLVSTETIQSLASKNGSMSNVLFK